jgi:NRPS condensation-like uncharacterized protein
VSVATVPPPALRAASTRSVPLNLLDELFLNLDREREPWGVHLEVGTSGRVDPYRLTAAIDAAAQRHPIARAKLAKSHPWDRVYRWEIGSELDDVPLTVVRCADVSLLCEVRERLFAFSPSLEASPPLAVVLAQCPGGDSILLNLHHAAGDGVSAVRLMRSILRAYAGEKDPVPALDPLAVRDVLALAGSKSLEDHLVRRRALARHAAHKVTPTARMARDGGEDRPGYGFVLLALTPDETRGVLARRAARTTVNDVLLATLAVAIRRWNAGHRRWPGRIALTMPVNLRPPEWREEVVGNFASYVTVSLGVAEQQDPQRALEVVAERTRQIKRDGLGGLVVDLLVGPGLLPVAAKRRLQALIPLTGNTVVDTVSLSNLEVVDGWPSLGDGAVQSVWFSPPGRMPLGAAVGAATVGGRLHVTMRYPHAQFDFAGARAFAEVYRDALLGRSRSSLSSAV